VSGSIPNPAATGDGAGGRGNEILGSSTAVDVASVITDALRRYGGPSSVEDPRLTGCIRSDGMSASQWRQAQAVTRITLHNTKAIGSPDKPPRISSMDPSL
jgi:hypothetical protein